MKKAEDYIIERETEHWADQEYCKSDIINWIKQAQIDAIEETAIKCIDPVKQRIYNMPLSTFSTKDKHFESSVIDSILQVAEQLKKELE